MGDYSMKWEKREEVRIFTTNHTNQHERPGVNPVGDERGKKAEEKK